MPNLFRRWLLAGVGAFNFAKENMADIKTVSVISRDAAYHGGKPFTINESDFDAKRYKLADQEDADDSPDSLELLTVSELRALAAERGVELKGALTKAAIIAAIEAQQ